MKSSMLKVIFVMVLGVFALAGVARAQSSDNDYCSNRTLRGDYAFKVYGQFWGPGGVVVLRDGVAMTHFDGLGGLTQVDYIMSNGVPVAGQPDPTTGFHINETGSYHVYPDCTGDAEIDSPAPPGMSSGAVIKLKFVLGQQGWVIHTIVSELIPPGAASGIPVQIHSDGEKLGFIFPSFGDQ